MEDIPTIRVFPRETVQPDDFCSRFRYYMLEGGKQQDVQAFQDSLRILDENCYHLGPHPSQALGIAESQDPEEEGSRLRRQIW